MVDPKNADAILYQTVWDRMDPDDTDLPLVLDYPPRMAWLSLTTQCNLTCTHCVRYTNKLLNIEKPDIEMSDPLFEQIKKELMPGLEGCILGGNNFGEQLISKKFLQFSSLTGQSDTLTEIITNGTALTRERAQYIVDNDIQVRLSLEGATEQTYTMTRGARFSKLYEQLKYYSQLLKDNPKSKSQLIFNFVMFAGGARDLPKVIELAAELGFLGVTVILFYPRNEFQRFQSMLYHRSLFEEVYRESQALAEKHQVILNMPKPLAMGRMEATLDPSETQQSETAPQKLYCGLPWSAISIDADGKVYPCCSSKVMGNLNDNSLMEIWNNKEYQKLRKGILTGRKMAMICKGCQWARWGKETVMTETAIMRSIGLFDSIPAMELSKLLVLKLLSKLPGQAKIKQILKAIHSRI
ncbi:MAG: SPASM domain-containing protein [Magnetococcales bacterium]|nr:SPASM domain-containing protein [Magnetococcales bacterium]